VKNDYLVVILSEAKDPVLWVLCYNRVVLNSIQDLKSGFILTQGKLNVILTQEGSVGCLTVKRNN
jgi:hypothetical protein